MLAAAGLLDGRRATTHWRFAEHLAYRYPAIKIDATCLYVDEGDILTSAGSSAGIERPVPLRREADRLSSILDHILANLQDSHTISSLARHAGMSERTFQRRFQSLTGLSPLKWILRE
ncbi:AraC family transcriptional regulator (plasmid) [Agrobacterium tumefaciens]|uniref:AraC family transcriptional regulator n=1 Tax=Agrobacterium tumefaciens TaxID=358 RepID=UPI0024DF4B22|nr:AraC family transcriptional regulator [Agrobacterium tumefaciens]WIE41439.1 AraC family transcriptional regulator [Agrobacterium tumefaciens]